jgi:hypothetical protein
MLQTSTSALYNGTLHVTLMVMSSSHYFDPYLTLQEEVGDVMEESKGNFYDSIFSLPPSITE